MAKRKKPAARKKAAVAPSPEIVDVGLMKALSHKDRVQCLSILSVREASPNELSEQLNVGLSKISYHVKVLKDFKLIKLVNTEPRRGAVEHFYRATKRAILPDELWKLIPRSMRKATTAAVLGDALSDITMAIEDRTFDARDDFHLSWNPVRLDRSAWAEMNAALIEFVHRLIEAQAESAVRLAESGEEGIPATFAIFGFESAREIDDKAAKGKRKKGR